MPNWCKTRTTIIGPAEDVASFVAQAKAKPQGYARETYDSLRDREPIDLSFHAIVPLPNGVIGAKYDPAGYNAERETWGVKWGACDTKLEMHDGEMAVYRYSTPWGPAHPFWIAASARFPNLTFYQSWDEEYPSMGRDTYHNGNHHLVENRQHKAPASWIASSHDRWVRTAARR